MGFPDLFFVSDIYIGLYDPISVADPRFWGKGGGGGRSTIKVYTWIF